MIKIIKILHWIISYQLWHPRLSRGRVLGYTSELETQLNLTLAFSMTEF